MNRAELIDRLKKLKPGEACRLEKHEVYNTAAVADVLKTISRTWRVTHRGDGAFEIKRDEKCTGGEDA